MESSLQSVYTHNVMMCVNISSVQPKAHLCSLFTQGQIHPLDTVTVTAHIPPCVLYVGIETSTRGQCQKFGSHIDPQKQHWASKPIVQSGQKWNYNDWVSNVMSLGPKRLIYLHRERDVCELVDHFFSVTAPTKWLVSQSEFNPFGLITFAKLRRAARWNHFIPSQISGAQKWKLAALSP